MRNRSVASKRARAPVTIGSVTVDGTITADAGTNLSTAGLALESGGNLAAILAKIIAAPATAAKQDTIIAALGSPSDTAWDGSAASASLIAIMKACYAKLDEIADNTAGP
jgi:hypothetical protein